MLGKRSAFCGGRHPERSGGAWPEVRLDLGRQIL